MNKKVNGSQILDRYQLKINTGFKPFTLYTFSLVKLIIFDATKNRVF